MFWDEKIEGFFKFTMIGFVALWRAVFVGTLLVHANKISLINRNKETYSYYPYQYILQKEEVCLEGIFWFWG